MNFERFVNPLVPSLECCLILVYRTMSCGSKTATVSFSFTNMDNHYAVHHFASLWFYWTWLDVRD